MPEIKTVMISSTARDLPEHRKEVMDACLRQSMFPVMMEHLPASDADAIAASLKMVDEADIYLGVFAHRYGYVPKDHNISITEMEYNRAVDRKIPRLIFIMHDDHPLKAADVETGEGAIKLKALKERLGTERVVNFFKSPEDLRAHVINSLSQFRQPDLTAFHYVKDASRTVEFTIVPSDITVFDADVVVLKHAQAFMGADETVASALGRVGVARDALRARPGDYRYVETRGSIHARQALFIGVPPISDLSYQQIRGLAAQALHILGTEAPNTRHVAMTIHGPGLWFDEVESLLAEFAGCFEAINMGAMPEALDRISIVDRDGDRVQRLRRALEQNLADADYAVRVKSHWAYRLSIKRERRGHAGAIIARPALDIPGATSEAKSHAFVAMPFKKEMDDVFYYGIQGPVRAAGFLCERVDQEAFTGDILYRVRERIENAAVVIADLSGANPNVYLEVGYAWGKGRPTILLVKDAQELRFDVKGQRCLTYETIKDLEEALTNELSELQSKGLI